MVIACEKLGNECLGLSDIESMSCGGSFFHPSNSKLGKSGWTTCANWLMSTGFFLDLQPETIVLALSVMDRSWESICEINMVPLFHAGVCVYVACKYMEVTCPPIEAIFSFLKQSGTLKPIPFLDPVTRIKIHTIEVLLLRAVNYRVRTERLAHIPLEGPPERTRLFYYLFFQLQLDPRSARIDELEQLCALVSERLLSGSPTFSLPQQRMLESAIRLRVELPKLNAPRALFLRMGGTLTDLEYISKSLN